MYKWTSTDTHAYTHPQTHTHTHMRTDTLLLKHTLDDKHKRVLKHTDTQAHLIGLFSFEVLYRPDVTLLHDLEPLGVGLEVHDVLNDLLEEHVLFVVVAVYRYLKVLLKFEKNIVAD